MSKPKEIAIPGKSFYAWPYEEQTQIKHKVLGAYAKIWVSKLGYRNNTLFFDCHGGCGAYIDNDGTVNYGSSIIVKKLADEVNKSRSKKTGVYYCEVDKGNYKNFLEVIKDCDIDCSTGNIVTYNKCFEDVIQNPVVRKYYTNYSTLFLVDPFGFNFCVDVLSGLMKGHGNEIIVNFMFDFVNRFISVDTVEESYNSFFGSDLWKLANDMSGQAREEYLVNLFKEKLKQVTGAKFVFAYRLCYPYKDQTYYYLMHATNHIDGITLMKTALASVNNGRVQYLGKNNDNLSFLDIGWVKSDEIYRTCLVNRKGKFISFEKLWYDIVEDTAFTSKDLNEALMELEKLGKVSVRRVTSKRGSYKEKDIVHIL